MRRTEVTESERRWLAIRRHYRQRHHELARAARKDYPDLDTVEETSLLTMPAWLPSEPVALEALELRDAAGSTFEGVTGSEPEARVLLPTALDGSGYSRYADVVDALAAPAVFENRTTYRLRAADFRSGSSMTFGRGGYFDAIDVGDAAAHEFTANALGQLDSKDFRARIGNPCDPARRPTNVALSTLTVRYDSAAGRASFPLHRRSREVGHAAGMYQTLPVGIFQPAGEESWNWLNDFDLWRNILRELAEELRGESEDYDTSSGPVDYAGWQFAARLTDARPNGHVRAFCLGIGVDPLTFATDLLTVVVIDAALYDELFGGPGGSNAEGAIVPNVPFDADAIDRYTGQIPMQAAGAALLRLAWRHRAQLLD